MYIDSLFVKIKTNNVDIQVLSYFKRDHSGYVFYRHLHGDSQEWIKTEFNN